MNRKVLVTIFVAVCWPWALWGQDAAAPVDDQAQTKEQAGKEGGDSEVGKQKNAGDESVGTPDEIQSPTDDKADKADKKSKKKVKKKKDEDEKEKAAQEAKPVEEKPEPSQLSKNLEDKLALATGFGIFSGQGDQGTWDTSGIADFIIAYRLPFLADPLSAYATFRYAPFDFTQVVDSYSFRGSADNYAFGGQLDYMIKDRLSACGVAELAYIKTALVSMDSLADHEKYEDSGVNFNIGGGINWQIEPKFKIGPRLIIGTGVISSVQLSVTAALSF